MTVPPVISFYKTTVIIGGLLTFIAAENWNLRRSDDIPILHRCCPPGFIYENEGCIPSAEQKETAGGDARTVQPDIRTESSSLLVEDEDPSDYLTLPGSLVIALPSSHNASFFRYRLVDHLPSATCTSGSFNVDLALVSERGEETYNASGLELARLTSRGELKLGNEYYAPLEFCIFRRETDTAHIRVCNATCTATVPCIRKCCDLNSVWSLNIDDTGDEGCVPAAVEIWTPELYTSSGIKVASDEMRSVQPHYFIEEPLDWCDVDNYFPATNEHFSGDGKRRWSFRIGTDGTIYVRKSRYTWVPNNEIQKYSCFDGGVNSKHLQRGTNEVGYSGSPEHDIMFECGPPRISKSGTLKTDFYGGVMIVSCIFLLLTLIVHALLWGQQTVHDWMRISYCVSLFLMYLFYAMNHFGRHAFRRNVAGVGSFCTFIGVGAHFFFLSTFSWLTMINLDLWYTFRKLKVTGGKSGGLKRYLSYATCAVIIPLAFTGTGLILDHIYGDDYENGVIIPEYAKTTCTPDPEYAQLIYQHGPAGILLLFNVVFFGATARSIYKAQKSTEFARSSSTNKVSIQRSRMVLFTKLLFVMGVPWIFEIISWIDERRNAEVTWYWIVFDLVNLLQGLSIFLIFISSTMCSLEKKYPRFKGFKERLMLAPETARSISVRFPRLQGPLSRFTATNDLPLSASASTANSNLSSESTSKESKSA